MNANILRALVRDAFYQVLDNWVFRILTGLTLLPILVTFLVGFREEGIVLLFGWKSWSYTEVLGSMGGGMAVADPQGMAIETLLQLFFDNVAGGFGILLAIAATAFFVPRLLEKGAADLYFHKPVSRPVLYLSRYLAGLLFISLSACVLVLGVFLGLAVSSQHVDPGVLLAAPTLVYVFALVFPFTMLVGVVTRSTVASILLSGMFFLFNGCIQTSWIAWEQGLRGPSLRLATGQAAEEGDSESEPDEVRAPPAFLDNLRTVLDVVRTVLPKTTDADVIARKLRRSLEAPLFRDEQEYVAVFRLPGGLERVEPARVDDPLLESLQPALGELRFQAAGESAGGATHYSLWSRPIERTTSKLGDKERVREETLSRAGERLEDSLAEQAGVTDVTRKSARLPRDLPSSRVAWNLERENRRASTCAHVFKGAEGELLFTLVTVVDGDPDEAALEAEVERLTKQIGLDRAALDEWYPAQLSFEAPWRTNLVFSVGSSLLFAAAILALGLWRLARIAF